MKRHPKMHKPVWTTVEGKRIKVSQRGTVRADGRANYFVVEPYHHRGSKFLGCHWLLPEEVSNVKESKKKRKRTRFPGHRITVKRANVDVIVKPCPWCGPAEEKNKPFVKKDGHAAAEDDGPCWIQCGICRAQGPESDDEGMAADRWNKRMR